MSRWIAGSMALALWLGSPLVAQELEHDLAELDSAESESFEQALSALDSHGESACARALVDFGEQSYRVRRARARLFQKQAGSESLGAILRHTGDPDPQVRRLLAEYLGELRLASEGAPERIEALVRLVQDEQRFVRRAALDSLERAGLPGTGAALDALLDTVSEELGVAVARIMSGLTEARLRLVQRVQEAFDPEPSVRSPSLVLAQLLVGYGRALAELPGGGRSARERAPLVLGMTHPSLAVQEAARLARDRCFLRLFALGEHERAEQLLRDLGQDGLARHLLLYRGTKMALSGRGDCELALAQAQALLRASQLATVSKRESFRIYGLHYSGMALFAAGDPARALPYFEDAAMASHALLQERLDLRGPAAARGSSRLRNSLGGKVMVERLQIYGAQLLWLSLCQLALDQEAGRPEPSDAVFERVREAHIALLEARILDIQSDAESDVGGIDGVLERDFGFEGLVLFNRKLEAWSPEDAGRLLSHFGRVCSTVMPWEFPGFEPLAGRDRRLTDPLYDQVRLGLYQRMRLESFYAIHRKLNEIQESGVLLGAAGDQELAARQLRLRLRWLGMEEQEELGKRAELRKAGIDAPNSAQLLEAYAGLARLHTPSLLGLRMGLQLRIDGLPEEARERGEAVLKDLEAGLPGANTVWTEWASSRLEEMVGATLMDQEKPLEAERILLNAVRRLEALENTLEARGAGLGQVQRQRANVLLSLAVNANVRLDDPKRALDFFERAFELDQRDFMQILRACYRARSGLIDEARSVLRSVTPTPQLYYNLACTYALLGDDDVALDYLQRELEENQPVPGALRRQQEWAAKDPDLKSLWEHPRFKRLVATD